MRRGSKQNWYVDGRNPSVGFLSRDEAILLYNIALRFQGRPVLEIGCWRGWSTAHLALGAGGVEVIDPVLQDEVFAADVKGSLGRAGVLDAVVWHDGYSPGVVEEISRASGKRWALAFVDGDHGGEAPRKDALAVAEFAADDAMIVFHDLMSPDVADGMRALREQGWRVRLYQTMQIMGAAWRGDVKPVDHVTDPNEDWEYPAHLADLLTSSYATGVPKAGELDALNERLRTMAEQALQSEQLIATLVGQLEGAGHARGEAVGRLQAEHKGVLTQLQTEHKAGLKQIQTQLSGATARLQEREREIVEMEAGTRLHNQLSDALAELQAQHLKLLDKLQERDAAVAFARQELADMEGALKLKKKENGELELLSTIHEASLAQTERALATAERNAWEAQRSAYEMEQQLSAARAEMIASALQGEEVAEDEPEGDDEDVENGVDGSASAEEEARDDPPLSSTDEKLDAFLNWYTHPRVIAGVLRRALSGSSSAAVGRRLAEFSLEDAALGARLQGLGSPRAAAATLVRIAVSGRMSAMQRIRAGLNG